MDASDARDDVSARVVTASVCVCFWIVWMRAMVSLEGSGMVKEEGAEAEAIGEVERVVGMVGGTEAWERAGDDVDEEARVEVVVMTVEEKGEGVVRVRARKRLHSGERVAKMVLRQEMRKNASRW